MQKSSSPKQIGAYPFENSNLDAYWRNKQINAYRDYLQGASRPPIERLAEKIAQLTEGEEQAIAEVGGQGGEIGDDHLDLIAGEIPMGERERESMVGEICI